ncbi:ABC transporter ATP-binding protein [Patescibacteria group bacterium]|nr:ABC transporter ATP-binding protein [Patescibacteria group bacterium]
MAKTIIKVRGIGKKFEIKGGTDVSYYFRDTFDEIIKHPLRFVKNKIKRGKKQDFWALKDVNFSVRQGEILGIIGENGSGKSTLLKILSRITPPTEGAIKIAGRVASLLEVGTGFNPELTGRENVFVNGAILGMKKSEIKEKFDEIVDFSGEKIKTFIDTPVKRYSSGMHVRLAFAVAVNLNPDILLLDEVLAVGDINFRKKSLKKMEEVSLKSGRTVLFVSHDLGAVVRLCNKCILLEKGRVIASGSPKDVVEKYTPTQTKSSIEGIIFKQKKDLSKKVNLRKIFINPQKSNRSSIFSYDKDLVIRLIYEINEPIKDCHVWIEIQNTGGEAIFLTVDTDLRPELKRERKKGMYKTDLKIPKNWLNSGEYGLTAGIERVYFHRKETFDRIDTGGFRIIDSKDAPGGLIKGTPRLGVLKPLLNWETKKIK